MYHQLVVSSTALKLDITAMPVIHSYTLLFDQYWNPFSTHYRIV